MSFFSTFRFRSSKRKAFGNNPYPASSHTSSNNNAAAFRPLSQSPSGPIAITVPNSSRGQAPYQPLFLQAPYVRAALVKGSFQTIVELPKYVDLNEWLALNVFEFNTYVTLFYSMLSEFITPETCPVMNAGPGCDYIWIDANKQPVRLPANTYIDYTLSWISTKFDDQTLFPTRQGVPFPQNFPAIVRSIYVQLFRIFAHIYHNHFDKIIHLSLEPHWNSLFCHFVSFGKTFNLMEPPETAPLLPLIQNFEAQGKIC